MTTIAKERLYLTADRSRLVGEGDLDAAFLYAAVETVIPAKEVKRFGIVDGYLSKAAKKAADKAKPKGEDKAVNRKGGLTVKPATKRTRKLVVRKLK